MSTLPRWRRIGRLHGLPGDNPCLWLRDDRPLSYLRVTARDDPNRAGDSFAKVAIESRNADLPRRYAVVLRQAGVEARLEGLFADHAIPALFAAFPVDGDAKATITLLTLQQVRRLAEAPRIDVVRIAARIPSTRVCVEVPIDPWDLPDDFDKDDGFRYEYRFGIARMVDAEAQTLVWPNGVRERGDTGQYVAKMTSGHYERLERPKYVVIENASDPGRYASARAKVDTNLEGVALTNRLISSGHATDVIALDRGVREVLGIAGGESAIVHAWTRPNIGRRVPRLGYWPRSVYAHPSLPLRGDLEKPVCRISADAMSAIGARDGDRVKIESLVRGGSARFERSTHTLRALAIDPAEAATREAWSSGDAEEGYVDCAAYNGIFPPYPTIYLDYFALKQLGLTNKGEPVVCPVVQVRPQLPSRFADEASEFAWIGIIGVVAVVAQAVDANVLVLILVAVAIAALLVGLRVRRAIR